MRSHLITFAAMTLAVSGTAMGQENPSGQITAVEKFVSYYSVAYSQGQDRIPRTPSPLTVDLARKDLALETIRPQSALTGNAFLAEDGTIVKLVGAQGCLSTQSLASNISCARFSIIGLSGALGVAIQGAEDAFPCHVFAKSNTPSPIKFAECFFEKRNGEVVSLSGYLVLAGTAFAARDGAGKPLIADNASFEAAAKQARSGIWSNTLFTHPYGERYRNNPINP
ncbi:nuclease [Phyllobacterium sophorae]|uniref:nuclease n=1 Tax=Phyllobacterium sophorae TaxID=1520277 RepID=UPI0011B1DA8C|nr:nuclease [Phyllobacterium sophorae]